MSQLRGSQNYIWSLIDVLGQGATGAVYRARHKKTGEVYAVKTFNEMSQMRPLAVQMREFDVLKKLHHENIVGLLAIEDESSSHTQVLVMELCTGGSLYNMLDNPENAYGIPEQEFFNVLKDVSSGMNHLKNQGIVHRDIKPGNIMRYIGEDGRSIYKLTDFGAARELQEEEQFMSLYGTEEYLYPDMYERAVLRRPSSNTTFDASVDLWSVGVTLYHVATGQLPFRPYGGRKNKETMHNITASKQSGVISGVQETEGGPIKWSRDMPSTCRLSLGARRLVRPLLAGLMESDPNKMWSFDKFFDKAQQIVKHKVVYVFDLLNCQTLHVFLDLNDSLMRFQDYLASQTDIHAKNQHLLFENCDFTKQVAAMQPASSYPKTSEDNPVFLLYNEQTDTPLQPEFDIPVIPPTPGQVVVETDAALAKQVVSIMHLTRRTITAYIQRQHLLARAANMFLHVLSQQLEHIKSYVDQFVCQVDELGKRIDLLESMHGLHRQMLEQLGKHMSSEGGPNMEKSIQELVVTMPSIRAPFDKLSKDLRTDQAAIMECYHKVVERHDLTPKWGSALGCVEEDRCESKMAVVMEAVVQTWHDFKRDKSLKKLSYNEQQIHKFEKHKMGVNGQKGRTLAENHCHPNLSQLFHKFVKWYSVGFRVWRQLKQLDSNVSSLQDTHASLVYQLDQSQVEYQQKLQRLVQRLKTYTPTAGAKKQSAPVVPASPRVEEDTVSMALLAQLQHTMSLVQGDSVDVRNTLSDGLDLLNQLNQKYANSNGLCDPDTLPR